MTARNNIKPVAGSLKKYAELINNFFSNLFFPAISIHLILKKEKYETALCGI